MIPFIEHIVRKAGGASLNSGLEPRSFLSWEMASTPVRTNIENFPDTLVSDVSIQGVQPARPETASVAETGFSAAAGHPDAQQKCAPVKSDLQATPEVSSLQAFTAPSDLARAVTARFPRIPVAQESSAGPLSEKTAVEPMTEADVAPPTFSAISLDAQGRGLNETNEASSQNADIQAIEPPIHLFQEERSMSQNVTIQQNIPRLSQSSPRTFPNTLELRDVVRAGPSTSSELNAFVEASVNGHFDKLSANVDLLKSTTLQLSPEPVRESISSVSKGEEAGDKGCVNSVQANVSKVSEEDRQSSLISPSQAVISVEPSSLTAQQSQIQELLSKISRERLIHPSTSDHNIISPDAREQQEIHVNIGRIEINAPQPVSPPSKPPVRGFDEYVMMRTYLDRHYF